MSEQDKPERKQFDDFALNKEWSHKVPKVEQVEIGTPPSQRENKVGKKQTTIQLKKQR